MLACGSPHVECGACRRRLPPGLARACSSHQHGKANVPDLRLCLHSGTVRRGGCPANTLGDL
jgi:hypothetical protein